VFVVAPQKLHLNVDEQLALINTQSAASKVILELRDASLQNDLLFTKQVSIQASSYHPLHGLIEQKTDSTDFISISDSNEAVRVRVSKYPKFGKVMLILRNDRLKELHRNAIEVSRSNGVSLIQLDKPIYTPEQEVKLRMLRLDRSMRPIHDEFRIQIIVSGTSFTSTELFKINFEHYDLSFFTEPSKYHHGKCSN
jgi:hypothetical protein